ncbi:MAG: hypothetical protein P1U38_14115 [Aeromicrobium sp.]|uniref:hypothetical protein n=1 Tax=Aeromicrobium sp. TaxID=1871063 RepID=UPI002637B3C9|nr:hypothetical protein [Aeromicrobium sp.]MDF1705901.1 hypothetical protein [Aeromicrobium sp.]
MKTSRVRVDVSWGRSTDTALLRRVVARGLGVDLEELVERRLCPACGAADHGRPSVRHQGVSAGWVSLSRHADVAVAAWSPDAAVGIDVDDVAAGVAWVRREARGKTDGSGITGADPTHVVTQSLSAPDGLVAALAVDAPAPWSITLT